MYERNAIVIERYFSQIFGYNEKNNLKNNYTNYVDLVNKIEKYQEATKEEDAVIAEYDQIIGKIKDIQRNQDILYKKNAKMQENRKEIFENIDENVDSLKKKMERIDEEIQTNNDEMKENGETYIVELSNFNEKSISRNQCSKNRRIIEEKYQSQLKETLNNINAIKPEKVEEIREFFKSENNIQEEIQNKVVKNGEKEKIPFDLRVIEKSIDIQTDIEEKQLEILCSVYDRTHRLFSEIKNDTIKLEKHKKLLRDSESRLKFLNAMKEYLTLFLDNERLNIVGGEKEHKKLMDDACENLEKDMTQIKNLYTLLNKEISGRVTKKMYKDLYHPEYLYDLEEQEKEFESSISRLNVIGTVIYPDYWRIEGVQKIFEAFKDSVENVYGRDLSEYDPNAVFSQKIEKTIIDEYDDNVDDEDDDDEGIQQNDEFEEDLTVEDEDEEDIDDEIEEDGETVEEKEREKEIDQILGFYNFDNDIREETEDDEENEDDNDEEEYEEIDEENEEEDNEDESENITSKNDNFDDEAEIEDEDYEYGFDEDDGYEDIDFDEDDEDIEEEIGHKNKKKK